MSMIERDRYLPKRNRRGFSIMPAEVGDPPMPETLAVHRPVDLDEWHRAEMARDDERNIIEVDRVADDIAPKGDPLRDIAMRLKKLTWDEMMRYASGQCPNAGKEPPPDHDVAAIARRIDTWAGAVLAAAAG